MCLACGHEWSQAAAAAPAPISIPAGAPAAVPTPPSAAPVATSPPPPSPPASTTKTTTGTPANPFATPATAAFQEPAAAPPSPAPARPISSPVVSVPQSPPPAGSSVTAPIETVGAGRTAAVMSAQEDHSATVPFFENPAPSSAPSSPPTTPSSPVQTPAAPLPPVAEVAAEIRTCEECGQVMSQGQTSCLVCGWSKEAGSQVADDDPFREVLTGTQDLERLTAAPQQTSEPRAFKVPIPVLPKGPQGAVANQASFFATSPMLFVVAGALGFFGVLLLGGGLMLALSGPDEVDLAAAQQTVRALSQKPDRSALDYITLGHAHADTSDVGKALSAYRAAAAKGSVDERSVQFGFKHLKDPLQGRYAGLLLAEVHRDDVTERLIDGVENDNLNHRRNSLLALVTRHEATDALREKVARLDLISDATCDMRKEALLVLEKIGASADAAIAIETAIGRGAVENSCMSANLPVVLRVVKERAGS